ncbi:class I SAM-dependent methyltransferase [Cohnella thailandensis]|uniref:SAM-dependent methyltransferase n=1 Tax=Cohnella thailandensis TaxID=557557 RepID=A0A841SUP4_9BACL|nr:SAM-dependent methyltransferase [Cohnella thailandensis]MBB6633347.1 SAM-dependent methyltransferase [Cohnella thailandensis]MBP1977311.1 putative DNA-binding ribbon-helix-helix protein [Cohnella thailandensis]
MDAYLRLRRSLTDFLEKFSSLATSSPDSFRGSSELERVIDDYSRFILEERNRTEWGQLEPHQAAELSPVADELRETSALCVAMMEKHRAWKLLGGEEDHTEYFDNIEAGIQEEFGRFYLDSDSKVLLVGSGAFPMTPLYIARRTGAEVLGIDIDQDAIELGRKVIARLGGGLRIRLENRFLEQLEGIGEFTHIIFSSTVALKYELLDQLHSLTKANVAVAMRFGNDLKSLFNYPMQETDPRKWQLADVVLHPDQVFDIAYYKKP